MLLRLLGAVEVADGSGWRRAGPAKQSCVLAALTLARGQPLSTDELIQRVWHHDPPLSASNVLYSHMTRLRALFNDIDDIQLTRHRDQGYRLLIPDRSVDVFAMRHLVARAQQATGADDLDAARRLWAAAAELWRGPALTGVEGRWADSIRKSLHKEQLTVLTGQYGTALMRGEHQAVVDELSRLADAHPTAEALTAQYMLALHRCGRPAEAIARYEETRGLLRTEFGVDPSSALRDLHRRMLRQDPQLDWTRSRSGTVPAAGATTGGSHRRLVAPRQLPADTTTFIGRDEPLRQIVAAIDGHNRVVTVDGMPGVGKTALAVRAAHTLAPRFNDGQLFVDLHGWETSTPPLRPVEALGRLLRSLGVPPDAVPAHPDERAAVLRHTLTGRRVLLLLDGARDLDQIRPLLPAEPRCAVLITGRRRFIGLHDAPAVSLDILAGDAAVELFNRIAERTSIVDDVLRVIDACGRLPLAIRIAATRLRSRPHWSIRDLLDRLSSNRRLRLLDHGSRSLSTALDASFHALTPLSRTAMTHLARTSPLTAAELGAEMDLASSEAEDLLEELCDDNLVRGLSSGRYHAHDLVREYARRIGPLPAHPG
ncbi:DNA-binding SARP family transcriptional activator [Stackebrandtia endophytica]|uniref:DNA-binding SARP family transcriptional activator n=1 Tax=Stackebrandtia endophytica TaxID=1496996 RepID=A0A543AQF2_9ACTN|nr:AfsR/SARP family transcriptional regulator [Stackebrandtia endophytica]TQL74821.1 DNA-binding SARP family transcriptional activator [Stackebrandtia endophytica]